MSAPRRHHAALESGYRLHWYEIESILGQGGFGITYLARDTNLDQKVAIKEFLPTDLAVRTHDSSVQPMSDTQIDTFGWGLNRFITEAQTLARFQHPNIVVVHSVFEENNTAYMVMGYVKGETLEDALKFRHIEGETQILEMIHPLLNGLELLHDAGYIHRDIKPDNIYIRKDRSPVLLDFGSARQSVGVQTRTLTALVSPGYAPFEQYGSSKEKERQGPWTDIYALGATMYRAVTGKGPPDAIDRANELMSGNKDILIPALAIKVDGYSREFLRAIDHAIEFLPEKRPRTIDEWRSVLPGSVRREVDDDADAPTVLAPEAGTELAPDVASTTEQIRARLAVRKSKSRWTALAVVVAAVVAGGLFWWQPTPPDKDSVTSPTIEPAVSRTTTPATEEDSAQKLEEERVAAEARVKAEQERLAEIAREQEAARIAEEARVAEEQRQNDEATELATIQQALEEEQARLAALTKAREEEEARQAAAKAEAEVRELARIQAELEVEQKRLAQLQKEREEEQARQAAEAAAQERARIQAEEEVKLAEAKRLAEEEAERLAALQQAETEVVSAEQERRKTLENLLTRAEENLTALRLTSPKDDNAYESFQAALAIDPGNQTAERGIRRIVEEYVRLSERASASASFDKAKRYLDKAERISPGSENIEIAREHVVATERKHKEDEQRAKETANAATQLAGQESVAAEESAAAEIASSTAAIQTQTTSATQAPASILEIVLHDESQVPIHVGNNSGDWGYDVGYRAIKSKKFVGDKISFQFSVDTAPSRTTIEIKTADVPSTLSCSQHVELNGHSERFVDDGDNGISMFDFSRGTTKSGQNTVRIWSKSCPDEKIVVNDFVIYRVVVRFEP